MYATLDPRKIIDTLDILERRISERFPGAGLAKVCGELARFATENSVRVARISRPNMLLRALIAAVAVAGIVLIAYVGSLIELKRDAENVYGVLQGIEALINIVIVGGAGAPLPLHVGGTHETPPGARRPARVALDRPRHRYASADEGPEPRRPHRQLDTVIA